MEEEEQKKIPSTCFWCATSGILDATWSRDDKRVWRCQWGHPADFPTKEILDKKEYERKHESP